jgi:hypothetical protein
VTVTVAQFLEAYPDFENTDQALIQSKLNLAAGRIATGTWGDLADEGNMALAAHLLSMSPSGENARLAKEDRADVYERVWRQMVREVTMGAGRVI